MFHNFSLPLIDVPSLWVIVGAVVALAALAGALLGYLDFRISRPRAPGSAERFDLRRAA